MHESPLPELLAAAETETGNRFSVIDHRLAQGMDVPKHKASYNERRNAKTDHILSFESGP
uniref:Uncharacterized protein n=1 Tax=Hyaloperonospora arabidopsidis (strain Emoy2) TaxID=559515 RepID=M4C2C1_HYAAE